jgi:hypothetical protein
MSLFSYVGARSGRASHSDHDYVRTDCWWSSERLPLKNENFRRRLARLIAWAVLYVRTYLYALYVSSVYDNILTDFTVVILYVRMIKALRAFLGVGLPMTALTYSTEEYLLDRGLALFSSGRAPRSICSDDFDDCTYTTSAKECYGRVSVLLSASITSASQFVGLSHDGHRHYLYR